MTKDQVIKLNEYFKKNSNNTVSVSCDNEINPSAAALVFYSHKNGLSMKFWITHPGDYIRGIKPKIVNIKNLKELLTLIDMYDMAILIDKHTEERDKSITHCLEMYDYTREGN